MANQEAAEFRKATDELTASDTHEDVAVSLGVSVQSVRQARLEPSSPSYRNPPTGWRPALASLARRRAARLEELADQLEEAAGE
jgi:hypothetical protein